MWFRQLVAQKITERKKFYFNLFTSTYILGQIALKPWMLSLK